MVCIERIAIIDPLPAILILLTSHCHSEGISSSSITTGVAVNTTQYTIDDNAAAAANGKRNITLDTINSDTNGWTISSTYHGKWFEYYGNTTHLNSSAGNRSTCAHVAHRNVSTIKEAYGIWAACQHQQTHQTLDSALSSGNPFLRYTNNETLPPRNETLTVKVLLRGKSMMRLSTTNTAGKALCFDYSIVKDAASKCTYLYVNTTGVKHEWMEIKQYFDRYYDEQYAMKIELIPRGPNDAALVDKIDSTIVPYKVIPDLATLETQRDAEPCKGWKVSSYSRGLWEYYKNSDDLISQGQQKDTCASVLAPAVAILKKVNGTWVSCHSAAHRLLSNISEAAKISGYPIIQYNMSDKEIVLGFRVHFHLEGNALLRLTLDHECFDHSIKEDTSSPCKFMVMKPDQIYWRAWYVGVDSSLQLRDIKLELITNSKGDAIVLDMTVVEHRKCYTGECSQGATKTTTKPTESSTIQNGTDTSGTSEMPGDSSTTSVSPTTKKSAGSTSSLAFPVYIQLIATLSLLSSHSQQMQ